MNIDPYSRNKLSSRMYDYSKQYLSFNGKVARLFVKVGLNVLFGIFLYFSIDIFTIAGDKIFLLIFIAGAVTVSFLADLAWENEEVKRLRKQEKRYARAFVLLNDDYKLAQRNIKARDEFLSIVSHELKTPLTIMLLKLQSELNNIRNSPLANFSVQKLIEVLKNSEQQINWLKSMVNNLLDVSLITTGRINLEAEDTNLVSLTKQVKQSFSEVIKREKYKIKIDGDASLMGRWDKIRLEQVITNLLSNAIKYGNGKPIYIRIFKKGARAMFIIKDNGVGITPVEQKDIFDLFKRAAGAGTFGKGLGVGLFITSQIVKIHGGKIKVSSKPAKGTSFTIELPLK